MSQRTTNVLSIQSHVAYGHVGNTAAAFPLQRLGFEVWRINTVQFSNHTGYGDWRGQVFGADHVADLVAGLAERGALDRCDAVLSGYMGDAALGEEILAAVARVKAANPAALYLCDPVMGDDEPGLYVRDGIPEFMREKAVAAADVITPNAFELSLLTGREVSDRQGAIAAARLALDLGPNLVLVTSLKLPDRPAEEIEMIAVTRARAWSVATPYFALDPTLSGAGDCVSALFLAQLLKGKEPPEALEEAAAAIFAVIEATRRAGTRELQLIAAQEEMVRPARRFAVTEMT